MPLRNGSVSSDTQHSSGPVRKKRLSSTGRDKSGRPQSTSTDDGKINLKPKVTLLNGVTIIVGSIIGSGIFVSPKGVIEQTGSLGLSLIVWVACGVFSLIGAYCYAELGTLIVRSGADYAYIFQAFGPFMAFLRLWVEAIIIRPPSQAIVAMTFARYITEPAFADCEQPSSAVVLLAAVCILVLTAVNAIDVKWATRVQDVFTYAKVFALVLIIITGFVQLGRGQYEHFKTPWENTNANIGPLAIAFYQGLFAYNGWNYLNYIIEELQDPYRNLPKAIFISVTSVTTIYTLANVAYFTTISPLEMVEKTAVAVTFAQRLYGVMWWIMPVFVALSTFGGVNGILFTSSRLFYAGSREGHMPSILCMVQVKKNTPAPAVIFMGLVSLVYLMSTDMYMLINYVGFVNWLSIGLSVVALLYFRYSMPDAERPIKVNIIFPIVYVAGTAFLVIVAAIDQPFHTGMGCLIICTGIPFYLVGVLWEKKPAAYNRTLGKFYRILQKLLLVVHEERPDDE